MYYFYPSAHTYAYVCVHVWICAYTCLFVCVCEREREREREKRERSVIYRRNLERKGFSGAQTVKNLPAMKETWV